MSKLDTLEPGFKEKVIELLNKTKLATGRDWALSDGRRTIAQQNALYAQGRTKAGKVVTNAKGGQSAHNFGLAADLWPLKNGDFDWGANQNFFRVMADIAQELGLTAGFYFKSIHDAPHVEDPRWKQVQAQWKEGKVQVA